jgi:membrane protein implicated in regulation of membrane protease activity
MWFVWLIVIALVIAGLLSTTKGKITLILFGFYVIIFTLYGYHIKEKRKKELENKVHVDWLETKYWPEKK